MNVKTPPCRIAAGGVFAVNSQGCCVISYLNQLSACGLAGFILLKTIS